MKPLQFILVAALSVSSVSAFAQNEAGQKPNAAPLKTMERARSYAISNRSDDTIVAAEATMTNGDKRNLNWDQPLAPEQARNVAVPSEECLASLTVRLKSGRTLSSSGKPDCRSNRILVNNGGIDIGSAASPRPPLHESP